MAEQADVTFSRCRLGTQIEFGQLPPAHRTECVPVEADVLCRGFGILLEELSGGIEFAPSAFAVIEVVVAGFAAQCRGSTNFIEVPLPRVIPGRLAPLDAFPFERLAMFALGAGKRPLTLVSRFEFAVCVVILFAALAHEDTLAQPTECRDAGLRFRHVSLGPTPRFIPDEPADRTSLEVGLVVCAQNPERHAIGELDCVVLALVAVNACWHQAGYRFALIEEFLQARLGIVACIFIGLVEP